MKNLDLGRIAPFDFTSSLAVYSKYQEGLQSVSSLLHVKMYQMDNLITHLKTDGWTVIDNSQFGQFVDCFNEIPKAFLRIHKTANVLFVQAVNEFCVDEVIQHIKEWLSPEKEMPNQEMISISYYVCGPQGVDVRSIDIAKNKIEPIFPKLYPDINIDALYNDYMSAKESILFLTGKPGVGKTTFLRYVLQKFSSPDPRKDWDGESVMAHRFHCDAEDGGIAYIKDTQVLMQSAFWAMLTSAKYKLLILDDLDFALSQRENKDNSLVSNLLSFSDGLFGTNTKILVTTNTQVNDIDEALLRPGRCFDFLILNPLSRKDALRLWCEELKMQEENFTLKWPRSKTVTQSDLMSFYYRINKQQRDRDYIINGPKIYDIEEKMEKILKSSDELGFKV
jgi:ATPase family associated with various cellular activities (AAA)